MDASRVRRWNTSTCFLTPPGLCNMINIDFEAIKSVDDIAIILGCSPSLIETVQNTPSCLYTKKCIPKKGWRKRGQYRIVHEVHSDLNNLQKNIATAIASRTHFPGYVQGFVAKRSIATNASLHLAQKYVLNLDIKDFFDTIELRQVSAAFKELGCTESVALILARLCTLHGRLVQGASTSPVVANLVCIVLDQELAALGTQYGCSYSRYADDITFSGDKVPDKKEIEKCLKKHGFELNPDKWKRQPRGQSQYVTGLTVFDDVIPRIPKNLKRQLRQVVYYASKYGLKSHLDKIKCQDIDSEIRRLDGIIAFMYSVEPEHAFQLDVEWQKILKAYPLLAVGCRPRNPYTIRTRRFSQRACAASELEEV